MVPKIDQPPNNMVDRGNGRLEEEGQQPQTKKQKVEPPHPNPSPPPPTADAAPTAAAVAGGPEDDATPTTTHGHHLCCAGCGVSESASSGPLLLFEDPEDDDTLEEGNVDAKKGADDEEKRFCARCMTGKKVRVFWPVDSQWYIADVQQYDTNSGEHLLRYPDGDTEWVRIGEDHTTNTQYKEYFKNHQGGGEQGHLTRLPSIGNGVSFALSQSFGMPTSAEDEKMMQLKPSSQQQRLFQQLNLDRTASSMSSFGMFQSGVGPRQMSFGHQQQHQQQGHSSYPHGRAPPFQILSPNYTHSFSSKIGNIPSFDAGPPPPAHHQQQQREEGNHWPPQNQYSNQGYYEGGHQMMYPYPPPSQPPPHTAAYNAKPKAPSSSRASKSSKKDNSKSKKALPKAWTKAEDEHLLDLVLQMKHPLKWSIIATSMSEFSAASGSQTPERTGKQCRERYVNHLNPRLKHSEFTPLEDATIWRLYATIGSQWAKMSKVIPGRTDNNLKNRFHNLKRQLIREEDSRLRAPTPEDYNSLVHSERVREIPQFLRTRIEDMWNHNRNVGVIAASSAQESRDDEVATDPSSGADEQKLRKFGPFETVTEPIQCGRCGMYMPSVQCGNEMCTKTKWCRVCTRAPMHLGGSVLRECLNLRKTQDMELVEGVDKLLHEVWNESS